DYLRSVMLETKGKGLEPADESADLRQRFHSGLSVAEEQAKLKRDLLSAAGAGGGSEDDGDSFFVQRSKTGAERDQEEQAFALFQQEQAERSAANPEQPFDEMALLRAFWT